MTLAGLPHSDTHGLTPACGYPWLFAADRVLLRLLIPRHSPCALCSLTIKFEFTFKLCESRVFSLQKKIFVMLFFCFYTVALQLLCYFFDITIAFLLQSSIIQFSRFNFIFFGLTHLKYFQDDANQILCNQVASHFFEEKMNGGLKWTRTTDLALIRRTL